MRNEPLPRPIRRVDRLGCIAGGGWVAGDFVGQRVKKVRGEMDVGNTGKIVALDPTCILGIDALVCWDKAGPLSNGGTHPAGVDVWTMSKFLEPITVLHLPCESEFKESLDRLLEGLPA